MRLQQERIKNLMLQIAFLKDWIRSEGERTNTCTYHVLKEQCVGCMCGRSLKKAKSK